MQALMTRPSPEPVSIEGFTDWDSSTELVHALAHEVRNGLATLQVSLEILDDPDVWETTEVHALIHQVKRSAAWMASLLENTQWVGPSFGPAVLDRRLLTSQDIIESAVTVVGPMVASRGQFLDTRVPDIGPYIYGDLRRLSQVLVNLLTNASTYGPSGDTIMVDVEIVHGNCRIAVTDHGPGVPIGEQGRIFDRYVRGSAASSGSHRGMGLGLYLAKRLIEAHGGSVGLASTPGVQTRFWFELPCVDPVAHQATAVCG